MGGDTLPEIKIMQTALALTTLAGLATAIGAAVALFAKTENTRILPRALAFSAGVMLCVSFLELLPTGLAGIQSGFFGLDPWLVTAGAFLLGAMVVAILETWIPAGLEDAAASSANRLRKAGLLTAVSLALHNFPEGVAVFVSNLGQSDAAGIALTIAVAIHNIPEGIAVAIPVLFATGSRLRAFHLAALSGLTEPLGALLAWAVLAPFLNPAVLGVVFAVVAGMMVYISLKTLLPEAFALQGRMDSLASLATGGLVMAASLLSF